MNIRFLVLLFSLLNSSLTYQNSTLSTPASPTVCSFITLQSYITDLTMAKYHASSRPSNRALSYPTDEQLLDWFQRATSEELYQWFHQDNRDGKETPTGAPLPTFEVPDDSELSPRMAWSRIRMYSRVLEDVSVKPFPSLICPKLCVRGVLPRNHVSMLTNETLRSRSKSSRNLVLEFDRGASSLPLLSDNAWYKLYAAHIDRTWSSFDRPRSCSIPHDVFQSRLNSLRRDLLSELPASLMECFPHIDPDGTIVATSTRPGA
jgi:hypothetical protein